MSYNNYNNGNRQYNSGGFPPRQYNGGGFQQPRQYNGGGYQQQPQQRTKKSGAKYSLIKKGNHEGAIIVNAWMKSRNGLLKITCAPYNGTHEVKSQNGNTFLTYIASLDYGNGNTRILPCLYNVGNKKITLSAVNLLITPNGGGITRSGKRVTGSVLQLSK